MDGRAETLARTLAERHARREAFTSVFEAGETPDLDLAYRVQDLYVAGLGGTPGGYKVGVTTARMQQMCGVGEPIAGVVLEGRIMTSPGVARAADYVRLGAESELAVRIAPGARLDGDLGGAALVDLVDRVACAFELVEDNDADYGRLTAGGMVADNSWNAGLVLGPSVAASDLGSLAGRRGVLIRGGETIDEGRSDDVLGDPLNSVRWLAVHLRRRGRTLKPGQWVSTGAINPTRFVAAGERYRFEVDGLPAVELEVR